MIQTRFCARRKIALVVLAVALVGVTAGFAQEKQPGQPAGDKTPLSEDAFIGKVLDREGIATIKPVMRDRWAVAEENTGLEPGDWLRTGTRGANVLAVQLDGGARLILGPGTLVEIVDLKKVRLIRGELEVSVAEGGSAAVLSPRNDTSTEVTGTKVFRVRDEKFTVLETEPRWLTGYKNNMSTEAMGSLLANIEGRNVPLTIGYHKVTVDIRDQIARTIVEESFVNHTPHVLEGIFYFPLPQDASISGFAMWIGNELVEADVVEKQRAREIYETILREKRDPGLLEWTGGNIFKARIYPIGSEKRIRITYTQVLPKTGGTYLYNYSLQSEMLRLHPLKQLQIEVKLSSAETLVSVECPSHACRIDTTEHSAHVEFEAQEYTPKRDFELRVVTKPVESNVVLIPHRRGNDGYFMLLVNAPEEKDKSTRPALANTQPMNVIIMADTSGSMSGSQRMVQIEFIEALLGSLGEKDSFNIVAFDVDTHWMSQKPLANTAGNRESALQFVEKRHPLGWSDLDRAFAQVIERAGKGTQVVYVGDGVVTTGDADPVAFGKRLKRMYGGSGIFHSVAPGSSYESVVLKAVAALGGGSVRAVGGGTDPAQTAFELLKEISSPVLKELKIVFEGAAVAAVYPEALPNLPAGMQQIIIGRYDPAGGDAQCTVTVSGMLDGKKVQYTEKAVLAGAEKGNSFIPRLWARKHLDHLLAQGASRGIRDRIIKLSEDFHIMTPYTSFLVLESDEDRKRFKVKRRFRMRDAEEFFAEGRDRADFELARKQMLKARRWRLQLRSGIMRILGDMNRDVTGQLLIVARPGGYPVPRGTSFDSLSNKYLDSTSAIDAYGIGGGRAGAYGARFREAKIMDFDVSGSRGETSAGMPPVAGPAPEFFDEPQEDKPKSEPGPVGAEEPEIQLVEDVEVTRKVSEKALGKKRHFPREEMNELISGGKLGYRRRWVKDRLAEPLLRQQYLTGRESRGWKDYRGRPYDYLAPLFPTLPGKAPVLPAPDWPAEVMNLVKTLNRRKVVEAGPDCFKIVVTSEYKDYRGRRTSRLKGEYLLSGDSWLTVSPHTPGGGFNIDWCHDGERGILRAAWLLGRVREKQDGDEAAWSAPIGWYFGNQFKNYRNYIPELKKLEDGKMQLRLHYTNDPKTGVVFVIDTEKSAIVQWHYESKGEKTGSTVYSDFVKAANAWWPTVITVRDKDGKVTGTISVSVTTISKDDFARMIGKTLTDRKKDAIILGKEPETLVQAKQAVKDGKARFEDYWLLLRYFAATQQWEKAQPHIDATRKLTAGKRGLARIPLAVLRASRRNEELKNLLMKLARQLAAAPREADFACASDIMGLAGSLNQGNERMELLLRLKPVFSRQKYILDPLLQWDRQIVYCLQSMGRQDEALAKQKEMAKAYPFDAYVQTACAQALSGRGEIDAALAHLAAVEKDNGPWREHEVRSLRSTAVNILLSAYRYEDFVETLDAWEKEKPGSVGEYQLNQYLSALKMLDREEKAQKLIKEWLISTRKGKLEQVDRNRLGAAIRQAIGQGYNVYSYGGVVTHVQELVETARYFVDHESDSHFARTILQSNGFRRTDKCRALQAELFKHLQSEVGTMPVAKMERFFQWLKPYYSMDGGEAKWQEILDALYSRWEKAQSTAGRQVLRRLILRYGRNELKLKYYRKQYAGAKDGLEKRSAAQELFAALLNEKWTQALQDELLGVLGAIAREAGTEKPRVPEANKNTAVMALYYFASWLPRARSRSVVEALPNVNEMPRRKLRAEWRKALKEARAAAAELFTHLEKTFEPAWLRPWLAIERIYLEAKLGTDTAKLRRDTMNLLAPIMDATAGKKADKIEMRQSVLAARCVATLTYLSMLEPDAQEAQAKLLSTMNEAVTQDNQVIDWKNAKYILLMALDRGEDLEAALREWYGGKQEFAKIRWGRQYAYILAERNDINRAVRVFEEIERIDELGFSDYRTLADWYMVRNAPDKHREAKIKSWQTLEEYRISRTLYNERYKYQRRGEDVPSELDAEIPLMFIALLRKAQNPSGYTWTLREYYEITKDFRLLECVPEAVIGQSAQKIYPFLEQVTRVTNLIRDEATLDRLHNHLVSLHEKAKSDVDRRALRLLEFMTKYRAATQAHGTEPHVEAALAALKQAYRGNWVDGEPEMMARFLAGRGALKPEALAQEQIRQLRKLHAGAAMGTYGRLVIAGYLAAAQWANNRREDAVRTLGGALGEFRQASGGLLGQSANSLLERYCSYLEQSGEFAAAEKVWQGELKLGHNRKQLYWLKERLYRHYHNALASKAEVSLGRGEALYRAVQTLILEELKSRTNESHSYNLVRTLCDIWGVCKDYKEVKKDIVRFAHNILPGILGMYNYRGGQRVVGDVADRLKHVVGPLAVVEFLVVRAENEPRWLRLQHRDFWSYHGYRLARARHEAKTLSPALSERLLAIVLKALREELRTQYSRNRSMYWNNHSYFWSAKKADFARTAHEVLKERANSEQTVIHIAYYLYEGLDLYDDAIEALYGAHRKGILRIEGQYKLCQYLHYQKRFAESIPILVKMVEAAPGRLEFRTMLMKAYFHTGAQDMLAKTLEDADKYFHEGERWTENVIAALGKACLDTELYQRCVTYYKEAIALHVKTARNRGIGDGILCQYYRDSAMAYSGLEMTSMAVDAAAGAIVSWGRRIQERQHELAVLERVLQKAKDIDGYVTKLDAEVKKTKLENPIVRKALGRVYFNRNLFEKALTQLRLAAENRPNDTETHRTLVQTYDRLGRGQEATAQLLKSAEVSGHDINLYRDLGDRYAMLGQSGDSERAYTNIVEMMPNESESHQALAGIRQKQNRWGDAAAHWRQVIRVRTKEPGGHIGLAKALVKLRKWEEARSTVMHLLKTDWPSRFGDVRSQAQNIQSQIDRAK